MSQTDLRYRVIIQARSSSARLPRKAFLPLASMPSVLLCLRRAANAGADVVLATSDDAEDDRLARLVASAGFPVVRGPLDDVLGRFVLAAEGLDDDDVIVRLTADNAFPDGRLVRQVADSLIESGADIAHIPWPEAGTPYGLGVEACRAGALRRSAQRAVAQGDREHVTLELKRSGSTLQYLPKVDFSDGQRARCTLDTPVDFDVLSALFARVDDPDMIEWESLVASLLASRSPGPTVPLRVRRGTVHSALSLGTAQLGMVYGKTNRSGMPTSESAKDLVSAALAHGFLAIDTARSYGESEARLGRCSDYWRNGQVHLITKLSAEAPGDSPHECRSSVDASVFRSCRELGVDSLDTVLLHRWAHRFLQDGAVWHRLLELRDEGVVRRIGASVQNPEEVSQALQEEAVAHIQLPVSILDWRWREANISALLSSRPDVTVHARSVFLQGVLLAGPEQWPLLEGCSPTEWVARLESSVTHLGLSSRAELCVRYALSLEWIDSLVVGFDGVDQLRQVAELSARGGLDDGEVAWLTEHLNGAPTSLLDPALWPNEGAR